MGLLLTYQDLIKCISLNTFSYHADTPLQDMVSKNQSPSKKVSSGDVATSECVYPKALAQANEELEFLKV